MLLADGGLAQTTRAQPKTAPTNVIAFVLGKPITADHLNVPELTGRILGPLLDEFAKENRIEPTPEELDALLRKSDETTRRQQLRLQAEEARRTKELGSPSRSGEDRGQQEARLKKIERRLEYLAKIQRQSNEAPEEARAMGRQALAPIVRSWKVTQALHQKYGGRVAFQQAGPEPVDAYRDFLREQEAKGTVTILDAARRAEFWGYFTNDAVHTFYSREEGTRLINTPWWLMERPPAEPENQGRPK